MANQPRPYHQGELKAAFKNSTFLNGVFPGTRRALFNDYIAAHDYALKHNAINYGLSKVMSLGIPTNKAALAAHIKWTATALTRLQRDVVEPTPKGTENLAIPLAIHLDSVKKAKRALETWSV